MNKNKRKFQKGFTLMEVLLATAMFAVILGGILVFSVRTIEAHTKSQAMQGALENARFAIEKVSKQIRMSYAIEPESGGVFKSDRIFIIDGSGDGKYCYKFVDDKLKFAKVEIDSVAINCDDPDFGDGDSPFVDLAGSSKLKVSGYFFVKETDIVSNKRGFVRTVIEIDYGEPGASVAEKDSVIVQSGVSLRDYYKVD